MPIREAGQVLGGKYRLVTCLGSGGMGSVWRAEHLTLSSPVAIKLIEPATAREPDALHRFLREARTAAALRSPHVVQIFDYGVDADTPYIVMELLDGESLAERLAQKSRLSTLETARIIQHISRALGRAHEAGIVHRDLKPENVFIVKNDDEEVAKVLDFGIVKADPNAFDTSNVGAATRTGTLLGTPYFMSPEQAESSKSVDHRADIWALGVIAYRCLLGELPFNGDSVGRLILEICSRPLPVPSQRGVVPPGFDAWFARACARDPRDRFESAKRAAAELSRLTDAAPASPQPAEGPQQPGINPIALRTTTLESSNTEVLSPARPRRRVLALAACAVLSVAAVVVVRSWSLSKARVEGNAASAHGAAGAASATGAASGAGASSGAIRAIEQRREALEAATPTGVGDTLALAGDGRANDERGSAANETAQAGTAPASEPAQAPAPPRPASAPHPTEAASPPPAPPSTASQPLPAQPTPPSTAAASPRAPRPPDRKAPAKPKIDLGI